MAGDESDRLVNNKKTNYSSNLDWIRPKCVQYLEDLLLYNIIFYSDLKPSSVAIIREVYDSENAHIKFEMELERALEAGVSVIVIEPEPLGEETARWIYVGNLVHKVSVYSGLCGIASGKLHYSQVDAKSDFWHKDSKITLTYSLKKNTMSSRSYQIHTNINVIPTHTDNNLISCFL